VTSFRRVVFAVATGVAVVAGAGATVVLNRDDPAHRPPPASAAPSAPPSPSATPTPTRTPLPLAGDPAAGPAATPPGVTRALAKALGDAALGSRVNALVVDAGTGASLYDRGSAVSVVPASTAKLFTAVAALRALGPSRRLETRVVADGNVADGVLTGDLVVVGGGDPTLTAGTAATYPQPARLADLARQVRKAGIRRVTGGLVVDTSLFSGPSLGPGWKPSYVTEGSVAPVTAFEVDGGRLRVDDSDRSQRPETTGGVKLRTALAKAGVAVKDTAVRRGPAPDTATQVAAVYSPTVAALVERLLVRSDNDLAEALGRHVAITRGYAADFAGSVHGIADTIAEAGLTAPALADSSGLSRLNRVTPAQLVAVVAKYARELVNALPVAAFTGTLATRYDRGPATGAAGFVRAKTGSLDNVATLAGVVRTRSGRLLVFAFAADRLPTRFVGAAARALDVAAAALASCGCA
jgi:D-alanyl-D-alanine carboxypeptidase/D-alanyl-D-alanine-endopeptidase (penicillin-binding protein 4)